MRRDRDTSKTLNRVTNLACSCPYQALCKRAVEAQCEQMYHNALSMEMITPVRVLRGRKSTNYRVACAFNQLPDFSFASRVVETVTACLECGSPRSKTFVIARAGRQGLVARAEISRGACGVWLESTVWMGNFACVSSSEP